MLLYRVALEAYARDLSGRGAQLYGGRWNPKGMPALYTAESPSQALLEYLPHFSETCAPPDLVLVTIEVPDSLSIREITEEELPLGWDARPPTAATMVIGRVWLLKGEFAALRVPSVMLPYGKGWNVILNPVHPELSGIQVAEVVPLSVDSRLSGKLWGNDPEGS